MQFKEIITGSKSIRRFAELENMTGDELFEFVFECYYEYMEMFKERLKYGRDINRIMSAYRSIDAFRVSTPKELINTMFDSEHMKRWFAYRFWSEADKQVREKLVDKIELKNTLVFMSAIPTTKLMEDIFNDKSKFETIQAGGKPGPQNQAAGTREPAGEFAG